MFPATEFIHRQFEEISYRGDPGGCKQAKTGKNRHQIKPAKTSKNQKKREDTRQNQKKPEETR